MFQENVKVINEIKEEYAENDDSIARHDDESHLTQLIERQVPIKKSKLHDESSSSSDGEGEGKEPKEKKRKKRGQDSKEVNEDGQKDSDSNDSLKDDVEDGLGINDSDEDKDDSIEQRDGDDGMP